MKDLFSKEHYYYKIRKSSMENNTPPSLFLKNHPSQYGLLLHFYKKILIPPSMIF